MEVLKECEARSLVMSKAFGPRSSRALGTVVRKGEVFEVACEGFVEVWPG